MNSQGFVIAKMRSCCFASVVVLCAAVAAFAQAGRGGISGTVADSGGAVIPGARVVLINHATGFCSRCHRQNHGQRR